MNKEQEILNKYNIVPIRFSYKNKIKIIETENDKYTIKQKTNNYHHIYKLLNNHNFEYYLKPINSFDDSYEIYPYIIEKELDSNTKAINLMYILSLLHNKTTIYKEINLDKIKEIYEEITKEINYLLSYYYALQDKIENRLYMSPAEYLLIRNINLIYKSLNSSRIHIDNWYKIKLKQKKERQVLLHNNLKLEHFLQGENSYLINWKKYKIDNVIYDFLNFYKNEYQNLEMENLFNTYQNKYQYTQDEKYLFYSLIQIPWLIKFENTNYINTLNVRKMLDYLEKTMHLISQNYEKNQKTQEEEFHQ